MASERTTVGNPLLIISEALPSHLEELLTKRAKLAAQLQELNHQIALCETLRQIGAQMKENGT